MLYAARYDSSHWTGDVTAYRVEADTGNVAATALWSAANLMDAKDDAWPLERLVLSASTASAANASTATTGISWEWDRLQADQQTALKTLNGSLDTSDMANATAQQRLAYLRGDRGQESSATPPGPFRGRGSRLGDIVNSKLWYLDGKPASGYGIENYAGFRADNAARPPMLYVGANDGMLHGFDAATGEEKIAYVPEGLHPKLAALTQPDEPHPHQYYVDGSPFTADLFLGTQWKTYLAGFLGGGGKGYFVLDVTHPAAFDAGHAAHRVVLDTTGAHALDPDIGHIFGEPVMEGDLPAVTRQITRLNDGRWALVTGNGYNSARERPVLLIQYLDGAGELLKLTADNSSSTNDAGNGLSPPRLIDLNGDSIPDAAYAGDLRGHLWKFDLSANSSTQWQVAFGGQPLFTAMSGATPAAAQPITSAPVWAPHPDGGVMLAFGTGRNLTASDAADTSPQSIYGIYDDTQISRLATLNPATRSGTVAFTQKGGPVTGRDKLVRQTMISSGATPAAGTVSSNPVPYSGANARRGWFIDLSMAAGQRVVRNPNWFDGDLIDIYSMVPARGGNGPTGSQTGVCDPAIVAEKNYRTTLDIIQGGPPKSRLYASLAPVASGHIATIEVGPGALLSNGTQEISVAPPGSMASPTPERLRLGKIIKRAAWRQLQ
jgi:type IV pilus assembly protein PilY1